MAIGTNHGVTYEEMKERHKPKKTTDDCYTPDKTYEAVLDWVIKEYELKDDVVIERPFWPDKDYTTHEYKKNSVVVDNPPFSILSKIVKYYQDNNIKFFLFAPALVLTGMQDASKIITRADIIYNGEVTIPTDFLTNMEDEYLLRSAPDLKKAIEDMTKEEKDKSKIKRRKNVWPDNLVTSARFPVHAPFGIKRHEATERISQLDSQKELTETKKTKKKYKIYGGGVLISDSATERLKEARLEERKARLEERRLKEARGEGAIVWELSDREKEIIKKLDEGGH